VGKKNMQADQEEAFIRAFIVPEKRNRYLSILANPRRRAKVLNELYHGLDTIASRITKIANRDHFPEPVQKLLRQKGAGSVCYLISPAPELDQQEMPLCEVLDRLIQQGGVATACCIPGRLAYYKAELAGYVLEHKPETGSQ